MKSIIIECTFFSCSLVNFVVIICVIFSGKASRDNEGVDCLEPLVINRCIYISIYIYMF